MLRSTLSTVVLAAALILVALPRFDRRDAGVDALTAEGRVASESLGDARFYVAMVEYFRSGEESPDLRMPFAGRVLAPWLASRLPLAPMTALNVVNLASLLGCFALLTAAMRRLGANGRAVLAAQALFVFSFPTFYYATIGYVEPVLLLGLGGVVLGIATGSTTLAVVALVAGCAVKESMLLAVPAVALVAGREGGARRAAAVGAAALLLGIGVTLAVRHVVPAAPGEAAGPSLERVLSNAGRVRAWAGNVLTFGPLGAVAGCLLASAARRRRLFAHPAGVPLLVGAGASLLLAAYAFAGAYADGRFLWTMYPFAVPMVAQMLGPAGRIPEHASRGRGFKPARREAR